MSAARVEKQVWDYVHGLLADEDLLRTRYEESCGDPALQPREEQERERIERKLEAVEREVQRLIDAYQAGAIELTERQERRRRSEEQNQVLRRRAAIQQQRQEREQETRLLEGLDAFCTSIQESLVEPSFPAKQKVLELVVDRIVVEDMKLTVRHIVLTSPVRLRTEPHPTENVRKELPRSSFVAQCAKRIDMCGTKRRRKGSGHGDEDEESRNTDECDRISGAGVEKITFHDSRRRVSSDQSNNDAGQCQAQSLSDDHLESLAHPLLVTITASSVQSRPTFTSVTSGEFYFGDLRIITPAVTFGRDVR